MHRSTKNQRLVISMVMGIMTLASILFAPGAHSASFAGYTLVQEIETQGRHVKLWRNTENGRFHGEITNAKWPDQLMLTGSGCPGEPVNCYVTYVPSGASFANTPEVSGVVDACGYAGAGWKCTCVVCLHSQEKQSPAVSRLDAAGRQQFRPENAL
ncbi:hypothetical protein P3102_15440 [Amycolatopsis sp. QT-25]|uniref:hypothetical protein n=1 Tax=Amycolatopsis sp. QT-25 TaxID=3034022 RepID=UPI0023EC15E5|nr:hypothetical protein [Amycolatopsis sp. QT-25]WET82498.1 hypothetical protein P3102_15440 [Amycolatopsis sp. QT-25]